MKRFLLAVPREQPHGDLRIDCGQCHTADRWTPVLKMPGFRHESTGFALHSAHAQAAPATARSSSARWACADCHADAHRGELGFRCEACHIPSTWTNQREMFQVHNRTRFP